MCKNNAKEYYIQYRQFFLHVLKYLALTLFYLVLVKRYVDIIHKYRILHYFKRYIVNDYRYDSINYFFPVRKVSIVIIPLYYHHLC